MKEKARAHVLVKGLVQGVFFRRSAKERADVLGLTGWVKNRRDGTLEVILEGEKERLEEMIAWLRKGPPLARVEDLEIKWEDYKNEFKDFTIKYD